MAFDIRRLDIYRKIPQDLTQPTLFGAIVSVVCCLVIMSLFVFELVGYISPDLTSDLFVQGTLPEHTRNKIVVMLNISLPKLDCKSLGLDIQDDMGRHEVGFMHNTLKTPINHNAGCRMDCIFEINKVPGNFHVSTHAAEHQPSVLDMTHYIHSLTFGDQMPITNAIAGNGFQTLKDADKTKADASSGHEYHLKLVPSIYEHSGEDLLGYQYTSAYRTLNSNTPFGKIRPAIWFRYDLTPITVRYQYKRKPFYSFITTICAIIGGIFTVAGIIDSIIFTTSNIFKKFELGKLS